MDVQDFINHHPGYLIAVFPIYFLGLWLLVALAISFTGGWFTLSKLFRIRSPFDGTKWSYQSGQMRWIAGYRNCLTVGSSQDGLYLSTMFLFRFMHPPLLIPWPEITVRRKRLWFLGESVTLGLGRDAQIPLTVRAELAQKLRNSAGAYWPVEEI